MTAIHIPDREELREKITPQSLRVDRILHAGFAFYGLAFGAVVLLLYQLNEPAELGPDLGEKIQVHLGLLAACGLSALLSIGAAFFLPAAMLKPRAVRARLVGDDPVSRLLGLLRMVRIVRLTLVDTAAMVGLVPALIGAVEGSLHAEPLLWLGFVWIGVLLVYCFLAYPSRHASVDFVDAHMLQPLRSLHMDEDT